MSIVIIENSFLKRLKEKYSVFFKKFFKNGFTIVKYSEKPMA